MTAAASTLLITQTLAADLAAPFRAHFQIVEFDLGSRPDPGQLARASQGAAAALVFATQSVTRETIDALASSVKVLSTFSLGTDHIDADAARARGLTLVTVPDVLSETCADTAFLLILAAARRAREGLDLVRSGQWRGWAPDLLLGRNVWGARLGIFGMGRIGRAIAARARGFGMLVHYHNRSRLPPDLERGATFHPRLEDLLGRSDIFCIACPGTRDTRHRIDERSLSHLPPGAVLVNISRGDIIVDSALVDALRRGHVRAAGLDVFAGEPDIHPAYRELPQVFALPHLGSSTVETRREMSATLASATAAALRNASSRP